MKIKNKRPTNSIFEQLDNIYASEETMRKSSRRPAKTLDEALLTESIEDVYNQYYASKFERDLFDEIIALDPTFNKEQDKLGTYGKWLLAAYSKGNLKKPEFRRAMEILFDFNERKRYLEKKDIFQYKTLADIRSALDNIQLTANQIAKKNRKMKHGVDLGEEAIFVGENDKWELWIPKTYAASTNLGTGSTWCTASTSQDHWYKHYTNNDGTLLIFLRKGAEDTEKYQAHIDKTGKVTTFMDVKDTPSIKFSTFIEKENLIDTLKKSTIPAVNSNTGIVEAENIRNLREGKPYIYTGERRIERDLLPLIQEVIIDYSNVPEARRLTHLPRGLFAGATQLKKITFAPGMKGVNKQVFPDSPEVQIYLPADWSYKNPDTGALKFDIDRATDSEFYKGRIHIVK